MHNQFTQWKDTIVALATPPGVGAIAVIRLSGNLSFKIINQLFPAKNLKEQPSHTLHVGYLVAKNKTLDEVVISLFKAPRSYTAEDVIEISCHGSPYIQQQIIDACIGAGARLAKPGEFTLRAFLNGKMDLSQAEAVADLITSNTSASHKTALNTIRGKFSEALKDLREQLIKFSALVELELDFSQEDVEFADKTELKKLVDTAIQQTSSLIQSFKLGNVIKNGVSVAIIGKPNAGKSTLLNSLLNDDRAIVSDIPGTTRDTIEEVLNIDGILFRLIDTAGIRNHSTDIIEKSGIEKSIQKMMQANVVLYLFDVNEMPAAELESISRELKEKEIHYLLVGNKIDVSEEEMKSKYSRSDPIIFIAAKSNKGLEVLKERMIDFVLKDAVPSENIIITNARHYHSLLNINEALSDIANGLENTIPGDLLALDIRRSLQYLGEITGEITNEDQLDYIFSKFCIGK